MSLSTSASSSNKGSSQQRRIRRGVQGSVISLCGLTTVQDFNGLQLQFFSVGLLIIRALQKEAIESLRLLQIPDAAFLRNQYIALLFFFFV